MKLPKLLCIGLYVVAPSILVNAADLPLVGHADTWRYRKGINAPQTDWKTVADASLNVTWLTGNGGFGYADNSTETSLCQTILSDMRGNYRTLYMRKSFEISSSVETNLHLLLTVDWDDGFIAWLDGNYLISAAVTGAPAEPAFNADASSSHESSNGDSGRQPPTTYDLGLIESRLAVGTHVLAIIGLNSSLSGSSDFIQIADLALGIPVCPTNTLCSDTNWTLANSPYAISNSLAVGMGATLTIEPGVIVQLDAGVSLTVSGRLIAEGAETNRILFTRAPGATTWGGITINGGVASPETRIAYAHFEFNGTTAIHSSGGTVFLDHLTFGSTDRQYVSLDDSSFIVSDCVFPTATAQFEPVHGTGGIKSGGHGIFVRNFFGGTIGYSDVVDFTGGNRPSPIVHFINNVFTGSQDDGVDLDGTDAWIEGNIFMHVHRNGNTPDSSAAISGGNNGSATSEVTIIGNLFFDCDNACTAKQGNFFTLINNTIVHTTKTGGIDGGSGVINVRDTTPSPPTSFANGFYLEGNIIVDAEELVRNYDPAQTTVTLNNNILPFEWTGPGAGNSVTNPMLAHVPQLSEAVFTNRAQAQIMRTWFGLQPGSAGLGSGPNGLDQGGDIPLGVSISGEPPSITTQSNATLVIGVNRSGFGIPTNAWQDGAGYTHYKWRLDTNAWSAETPIATPIVLTGLAHGPHYVEVSGKRDSGLYQDDPVFGLVAAVTRSRTWTVADGFKIDGISVTESNAVQIQFIAEPNTGYRIEYRESLSAGTWQPLVVLDPIPTAHAVTFRDPLPPVAPMRFYRLSTR